MKLISLVFLTLAQFLVLKWGVILLLFLLVGVKSFILSGPLRSGKESNQYVTEARQSFL